MAKPFWEKFLRFFNILEPSEEGKQPILSLSKFIVLQSIVINFYVVFYHIDLAPAVIGATGNSVAAVANYAFRRWCQVKDGGVG